MLKRCLLYGVIFGAIAGVAVSFLSLRLNQVALSFSNVAFYTLYHILLYCFFGILAGGVLFFFISVVNRASSSSQALLFKPVSVLSVFVLFWCFFVLNLVKNHSVQIQENSIKFDFSSRQSADARVARGHNYVSDDRAPLQTVVFALDAADFSMIDTLRSLGELPTFDRLIRHGVRAGMRTLAPTRSPVLWTTIATSRPPREHGIWDFVLSKLPGTSYTRGRFKFPDGSGLERFGPLLADLSIVPNIPYTSNLRRTKAFWEILSDYENTVGLIGWYTTFPAEAVNGFMVSDGLFFSADSKERRLADLFTYPPELYKTVRDSIRDYRRMGEEEIVSVFDLSPATWDAMQRSKYTDKMKYLLRETYTKDLNTYRVSKRLLSEEQYSDLDVSVLYFKALDEISHATCEENIDETLQPGENDKTCWDTITATYRYIDSWMADILALLPDDLTVILLSDHGFSYGNIFGEGKTGHWEAQDGIFVISGPNVKKGQEIRDVTILDFLPTLLYLQDIPVAVDLRGRVLKEAFEREFFTRNGIYRIATYEYGSRSEDSPVESDLNKEIEKKLKSLGYIK